MWVWHVVGLGKGGGGRDGLAWRFINEATLLYIHSNNRKHEKVPCTKLNVPITNWINKYICRNLIATNKNMDIFASSSVNINFIRSNSHQQQEIVVERMLLLI